MARFAAVLIVMLFAVFAWAVDPPPPALGIQPFETCPDVVIDNAPLPCRIVPDQAGTWQEAKDCLVQLVAMYPNIFLGAVMGYRADNGVPRVFAHPDPTFKTNSVVSLASVSKPPTFMALVKLIQDHTASTDCRPITARCVFPDGFKTRLSVALQALDRRNGTDVYTRWWNAPFTNDPAFAADVAKQAGWKNKVTIQHLAQMTSGFPEVSFTGYRFCLTDECPPIVNEISCRPNDLPENAECRYAFLYNHYMSRRGGSVALPDECRPRRAAGPRLFDFGNYYGGNVYAEARMARRFERRTSFEVGLFGECVMLDDAQGKRWVDGRLVRESDVAKYYLGAPLKSAPGVTYRYSQLNLYATAFLIEALSGMRFDDYLKAKIFTPLGMTDSSFVVKPGTSQYSRLVDIQRVRRNTPMRVLPDVAPGLDPNNAFGADKNWDEARSGWEFRFPEGGMYSSAGDLLTFLHFIGTGMAGSTQILDAASLHRVTSEVDPVGPRTYAFRAGRHCILSANGYFTTYMQRDQIRCQNIVILPQMVIEAPDLAVGDVRRCDYQYNDVTDVRNYLLLKLQSLPSACVPAPRPAAAAQLEDSDS